MGSTSAFESPYTSEAMYAMPFTTTTSSGDPTPAVKSIKVVVVVVELETVVVVVVGRIDVVVVVGRIEVVTGNDVVEIDFVVAIATLE